MVQGRPEMTNQGRIGKYELMEFLGGGMSHVYRARDTVLGRTVAIKILSKAAGSEARARFLAEARLASQLKHENVLGIYDFGEDERNGPYMVMEFLRGQSVRAAIQKGEAGDLRNRLRIAIQVARALGYLHSEKVIHRDVKPDNMHLDPAGVVKLMDYGIAKAEGQNLTQPGFVLGTPSYMAPEQIMGEDLTEQVDVYGYGVFLFELLTGAKPISGDSVERIFDAILNQPLDLAPLERAGVPRALRDLVERCMAKDPGDRPQGFEPVCAVLEPLLSDAGTPAVAAAVSALPVPPGANGGEAELKVPAAGGRSRRWTVAATAAGAWLTLLAVGLGLAWPGYFRLRSRMRTADDAVSVAGMTSHGALSPEALAQLDDLREAVAVLGRYRRQGAPIGYRLGSLIGGDLEGTARQRYFEYFRRFFLRPAQNNQLLFLRSLPATPGPAYGPVYETLKAYLATTTNPAKTDPHFLAPVLVRWWSNGRDVSREVEDGARRQFEFYAEELGRGNPYPAESDAGTVEKARQYLKQFADTDRIYALLMGEAAGHGGAVNFNRQFVGSERVLKESYEVPAQFSKAGWDFVTHATADPKSYFGGEPWVAGRAETSAEPAQVADSVAARYRREFVGAWRQYLRSAAFAPVGSVAEAAQRIKAMAGPRSVLEQWLSLAAANTAVGAPEVADVFRAVRDAQAAAPRYRSSMARLGASLEEAAGQGPAAPASAAALARQSLDTTTEIAASFHPDREGHLEAQIVRMLDEPILTARSLLRAEGAADWNARGSELCSRMKTVLSKYPFAPQASEEASVAEIIAYYRPADGVLWKYYREFLEKLISREGERFVAAAGAGAAVNPDFLSFLERSAAFSSAAFANGAAQPSIRYTLRPVIPPAIESVKLTIDGKSATFRGSAAGKAFAWPGNAVEEMRVEVKFRSKGEYKWNKAGTPWSVLLFFDTAARRNGAQIEIPLRGLTPAAPGDPEGLWFEVAATPPVFEPGYFSKLACVARVVAP